MGDSFFLCHRVDWGCRHRSCLCQEKHLTFSHILDTLFLGCCLQMEHRLRAWGDVQRLWSSCQAIFVAGNAEAGNAI